ncbi:ATP-binding protein [Accumulibacter sp.]|uniref:ATP-binding protein n=1 Tax=Accumulibacter sp. TaxID=2053492 RepID=UPI002602CA01|nr:ATP-binding protein [Accumulibacter sp.]
MPDRRGRPQSLRRRLLRTVGIAAMLALAASGALSYRQAQHEAEELMDGHLAQSARLLLALASDRQDHLADLARPLATLAAAEASGYEAPLEFQIGRGDGSLLLRSQDAPNASLLATPGYTVIEHDGHPWRLLTVASSAAEYRVQVGQSIRLRDRAALELASQAVLPMALISPMLLLLIYLAVRRALKPLDDLAGDVAARSPANLEALPGHRAPLEAQPLISALNRLLIKLRETLDRERRFTADAAHELRTPLAAVRVQAQVAQLTVDTDDRRRALAQVLAGSDRATRVVEQLLRLARLDPLADVARAADVDLAEIARQVFAERPPDGEGRQIRLRAADRPLQVSGDAELLRIVLGNLLDNGMRHTLPGSTITVFARRDRHQVALGVADDGPGVAPDELPRLAERFYRGRAARSEGSGLGLAISQRIAELHGTCLEFENLPGGGFEARLRWPGWRRSPAG